MLFKQSQYLNDYNTIGRSTKLVWQDFRTSKYE